MRSTITTGLALAAIMGMAWPSRAAAAQQPDETAASPQVWVATKVKVPALVQAGADEILQGQPVPRTFAALRPNLRPGSDVIVLDESGHETHGRVLSLSDSDLVLVRQSFFRAATWTAPERSVKRMKIVDSSADGTEIGLAVVLGGMAVNYKMCSPSCSNLWGLPWVLMAPVAAFIGRSVDGARNGTIYEAAPGRSHITFAPFVARGRAGIGAQISF